MKGTRIVALLFQHDDDDFSLWLPEIPPDDPLLFALCDKYATSGSSVRGDASGIVDEIAEILDIAASDEDADCNDQCIGCERACADRIVACESSSRSDDGIGLNGEEYTCAYCGTKVPWEQGDESRGGVFVCEKCGKHFCTACFEQKSDLYMSDLMRHEKSFCPDCIPAKYHPWTAYCAYLREWGLSHRELAFCGNTPACYDEWLGCEWELMRREGQEAEAEYVHVILYYDPQAAYVGLDVFASYDDALQHFRQRLQDTRDEHPEDPDWIESLNELPEELHFRDKDEYEVFYCREIVQ